jgi:hypothetical protein
MMREEATAIGRTDPRRRDGLRMARSSKCPPG